MADTDHVHICYGPRMVEHGRESLGMRWCFRHRKHEEFFQVVMVPAEPSYYGPHFVVEGPFKECFDMFPGTVREARNG